MPKTGNKAIHQENRTRSLKIVCFCFLMTVFSSFKPIKHPYYLGVVDIKYDAKQQYLNLSIRLFTNDLQDALRKTSGKSIDILNPKDKPETDSVLFDYIVKRLMITVNSKKSKLNYIGYEKEEESIWTYLEIKKVALPKTININTHLLYDFLPQQIIIIHADVNGIKKSIKITNPDNHTSFTF